jgi:hypothetical protein
MQVYIACRTQSKAEAAAKAAGAKGAFECDLTSLDRWGFPCP